MKRRILTVEYDAVGALAKALSSPVRRKIIEALAEEELSIQELADQLGIPQSTCTVNVQALERTGLISTRNEPGTKGSRKICTVAYDEAVIPIHGRHGNPDDRLIEVDMPIGLYTNYETVGPCGLVSESSVIGRFDHVESFLDPHRGSAQLIWFTDGWLEYSFPMEIAEQRTPVALSVSVEVCSEFPGFKNTWPSDITVWIEDLEIGTWRSPGDMGGRRGKHTPVWWSLDNTQFGYLKEWRVTPEGSFLDGTRVSDVSIDRLQLKRRSKITARIGISDHAEYRGGINIFGRRFGNVEQDIMLRIELD
jgi:predicted transcriptional regulator